MAVETRYEHVMLDEQGTPVIIGTTMKVKELVAERLAWGWSPEELLVNHPYLTLGQIYSALAYYADHQAEIDKALQSDVQFMDELRLMLICYARQRSDNARAIHYRFGFCASNLDFGGRVHPGCGDSGEGR